MGVLAEVVPRDATSMSAEGKPSTPELAFHGCDAATVAPVEVSAGSADIQCPTVPSMVSGLMGSAGGTANGVGSGTLGTMTMLGGVI